MMRSIKFPDMFSRTVTNTVDNYDATLQNLKMLLWSEKGELFGDPEFGTGVKRYLYDQGDYILADLIVDNIYTAIATFMPQIYITRNDIKVEIDRAKVVVTIRALNRLDFTTNLYNIVLLDTNA